MYGPDDPSTVASLPSPGAAAAERYYGASTVVTVDQMNMLVQELRNAVVAGGLTPSKTTFTQLSSAIGALALVAVNASGRYLAVTGGEITGSLGIGTASPVKPLHVASSGSSEIEIENLTGAANYRSWNLLVDGGSGRQNFTIRQLSDDGVTAQLTGLIINGTTGAVTIPGSLTVTGGITGAAPSPQAAQFQGRQPNGTASGETIAATSWTQRVINTTVANGIAGASLASNQITLPPGTYTVTCQAACYTAGGNARLRLRSITGGSTLAAGPSTVIMSGTDGLLVMSGVFTLGGSNVLEVDTYSTSGTSGTGGHAASSGEPEVYVDATILKIA